MEYPDLVRMGTLFPFFDVLRRAGCPIDRHLEQCRLLRQVHESDPETYIPLASVLCFLETSSRAEGMEDLGFMAGSQTTIYDLGEFGRLILRAPTILQALRLAQQATSNYNTSVRFWMIPEGNNIRLCREFRLTSPVGLSHADHFAQLMTWNTLRIWGGSQWRPDEIVFQSRVPNSFDLESRIGMRVRCMQGSSSLLVPRSILAKPIRSDGQKKATAAGHPHFDSAPEDPIDALRNVIKAQLFEGYSDIRLTAEAAGMSVRTLQRRLVEAGLTYSRVLDDVRFTLAVSMMKNRENKMIEIALDLGYDSPGSFTRAFRRWSGFSPKEFRELNSATEVDRVVAKTALSA
jgi:AraC-like DNA-binding protein